jgi:hypothetical protein
MRGPKLVEAGMSRARNVQALDFVAVARTEAR